MPKSNFLRKKSKTGGSGDFKRLKAKVGKRAPQAASHTDTSFKSKRVKVSAQSILHDLGGNDAITARGQGVHELLVQLRHFSPASKREALAGLKSIVDRHGDFAEMNLGKLAEASLELAVCFDSDVRKMLISFQEALLGRVSSRTFSPFASLYIAYVVSAMTSLDAGVRRDGVTLLTLLLAKFPAAVAERAERIAPNYVALLASDPASKKQAGRAAALESLVGLLRAVSQRFGGKEGSNTSACADRGVVTSADGKLDGYGEQSGRGAVCLSWKRGSRRNSALMLTACSEQPMLLGGEHDSVDAPAKVPASVLPRMLGRLREVWMEALASVPPDIGVMQSVVDVLLATITSPLFSTNSGGRSALDDGGLRPETSSAEPRDMEGGRKRPPGRSGRDADDSRDDIGAWMKLFVPEVLEAFPLRPLEGDLLGDSQTDRVRAIQGLNMGLCELVVAAFSTARASGRSGAGKGIREGDVASDWLAPILTHVHEVLRDGAGRGGVPGMQISSVLRVLDAAIRDRESSTASSGSWMAQRQHLLSAFGVFFEALPPKSEAKQVCVRFVSGMARTLSTNSSSASGSASPATDPAVVREVRQWLQSLPELLCAWGGEFPDVSAVALRALVEVAKRAPAPSPALKGSAGYSRREAKEKRGDKGAATAPPTGGAATAMTATAGAGRKDAWRDESLLLLQSLPPAVLGELLSGRDFLALPKRAQMDAVALLYHVPVVPPCVTSALATVCSEPDSLDADVRSFVLEVVHHRRRSLSPSAYLGFLIGVLTGVAGGRPLGGVKRTVRRAGGDRGSQGGGDGKRRRRQLAVGAQQQQQKQQQPERCDVKTPPPAISAQPAALWDTVFCRDEVTGAVCNSMAMLGTRGGALLEALRPTLLHLLRYNLGGEGRHRGGGGEDGGGLSSPPVSSVIEPCDQESLATRLQRQRAAMACVLCCWDGLEGKLSGTGAADCSATEKPSQQRSESPLSALERPVAVACVQAMKAAGTADAVEQARGARLLRPVLVLVKRWPALLPQILLLVRDMAFEAAAIPSTAARDAGEPPPTDQEARARTLRTLEPLLRALQVVVRDTGMQGHMRRRHLGALRSTTEELCRALRGSTLREVAVQLRADVDVLGGGVA